MAGGAVISALAYPVFARADCVVRGDDVSLDQVVVRPSKGPPFTVAVAGVAAIARIAGEGPDAAVTVVGVVAFTGTARNVWYTLAAPVTARSGMVRLLPGARLIGVRARASKVVGAAVVRAGDSVAGQGREPDEKIDGISVPCGALTLDQPEESDEEGGRSMAADRSIWGLRGHKRRVVLRASPSPAAAAAVVVAPGGDVNLVGERLAERGGWMQITILAESVHLTGWIPRRQLEKLDSTIAGASTCGCMHERKISATVYGGRKPSYEGAARIAPGAMLSAPDGQGNWARVEKQAEFHVVVFDDSDSVQVTGIPGVDGLTSYGYVQRAAVTPTPRPQGGK